jgi:hypothetical protein
MTNETDRDARLSSRTNSDDRAGREEGDRSLTEDRQVLDAERLEQFRQSFAAEKLPRIPPIEGYHVCWLTTTNPADPVYRRLSLGYVLIKAAEVPGLPLNPLKGGEYDGCIMVGEMLAAKIPVELYEMYMTEVHHTQPLQEEGKLRSVIDVIEQEARRKKARVDVEEGSKQLGRAAPKPIFEGVGRRRASRR